MNTNPLPRIRRRKRWPWAGASLLTLGLMLGFGNWVYMADPIELRVVDADTGQPVVNAIVVVNYILVGGLQGHNYRGTMQLSEQVTDSRGVVRFTGWGPRLNTASGKLRADQPRIIVYAPQYGAEISQNDADPTKTAPYHLVLHPAASLLKIRRQSSDNREYADQLRFAFNAFVRDTLLTKGRCHADAVPRYLQAMDTEATRLNMRHTSNGPPTMKEIEDLHEGRDCKPGGFRLPIAPKR